MFQELEDWHKQRLGKFTASEIGRLLKKGRSKSDYFGDGAMSYIHEKIAELITGQPTKDLTGLSALEWGNAHEFEALEMLRGIIEEPLGIYGGSNQKFFPYNEYSGGSPDGETPTKIIEVKCPINPAIHAATLIASKQINPELWLKQNKADYYAQLQFNMMCREKELGLFVSYDPRPIKYEHKIAIIEVTADVALQSEISERIIRAGEIVSAALETLFSNQSILIAHHDNEVNTTIVEGVNI